MAGTWHGSGRLELLRAGFASPVELELYTKPTPPGKAVGWGGRFRATPWVAPAIGRGVVVLEGGEELEVMVESYDPVTGRGSMFGLGAPPRVLRGE